MAKAHPFLEHPLTTRWSELTPEHVEPDLSLALERGEAQIGAIKALANGRETFANTFLALEEASENVSSAWTKVSLLESVNDSPQLREAHRKMLPRVTAFFSSIPLDQELYRKLRNFAASEAHAGLNAVEKRFVSETLQDFLDEGADKDDATRERLKEIDSLLADKTKTFSENVLDSTNAYELIIEDRTELAGLPDSLIEAARMDALKKGHGSDASPKFRFTLQAPSFVPAMRFLDSGDIRRKLYEAYARVGHCEGHENEPLIREILSLRNEKARLLGKEPFPDWVLSRRMAKTGINALAFVEDLHNKTKAAFDQENEELMAFKAESTGQEPTALHPWEFAYWSEKLRLSRYEFDEEQVRPYFPLPSVMSGMFSLVEHLFGISVRELSEADTWDPEVRFYEVRDSATKQHLGSFYTDWFPRENKRSGAWMSPVHTGRPQEDGQLSPHVGMIAGNMSPQVGDKPALLTHDEVETVFHEFGHLLHHVLSDVRIRSLGGTNVAWDFVELPSQIMENWCWERESLDHFARHYETGEPIPEELFQKMRRARTFNAGRFQMRQLFFGKMDLALHLRFDPQGKEDLDAFIEKETEGYVPPMSIPALSNIRAFSHLFSDPTGYAAGYYSYKWAEVLDADAFTRFANEGILNKETGKAFRSSILSKGNSEAPEILFRNFMHRDPDPEALMLRLGLAPRRSA